MQRSGVRASSQVVWQGEHAISHHKIEVKTRQDRHLLMSIYEQGKWIFGIRCDIFASTDSAGDFVKLMAEEFAKGKTERDDHKNMRDVGLAELGIDPKPQRAMKKPAAAAADSAAAEAAQAIYVSSHLSDVECWLSDR